MPDRIFDVFRRNDVSPDYGAILASLMPKTMDRSTTTRSWSSPYPTKLLQSPWGLLLLSMVVLMITSRYFWWDKKKTEQDRLRARTLSSSLVAAHQREQWRRQHSHTAAASFTRRHRSPTAGSLSQLRPRSNSSSDWLTSSSSHHQHHPGSVTLTSKQRDLQALLQGSYVAESGLVANDWHRQSMMEEESPRLIVASTHEQAVAAIPPESRRIVAEPDRSNRSIDGTYYGPTVATIDYYTLTCPPAWTGEAALMMPHMQMKLPHKVPPLERQLRLRFGGGSSSSMLSSRDSPASIHLTLHEYNKQAYAIEPQWNVRIDKLGLHVKPPPSGGCLQLYEQSDGDGRDWHEHTFASAHAAAQFQLDVLTLQLFGSTVLHLYQALELCHQGSLAYTGREFVRHDVQRENGVAASARLASGIAWDDTMRCLGAAFPSMRSQLQHVWWQYHATAATAAAVATSSSHTTGVTFAATQKDRAAATAPAVASSTEESLDSLLLHSHYHQKRLLLGPVDFFRLFVPALPIDSVPKSQSSDRRMEQLLRYRKRVARAAVLVNAYARARTVANQGWHLEKAVPVDSSYLSRRLAYDDNTDNLIHDLDARNEYYEPTVSRDVVCEVRNAAYCQQQQKSATSVNEGWSRLSFADTAKPSLSLTQAFCHVGMHAFALPDEVDPVNAILHYTKDPVLAIPSLRKVIEQNSDLSFFVIASFRETERTCVVNVFCRALGPEIDPAFDRAWKSFVEADSESRKERLEMIIQLGADRQSLPLVTWIVVLFLSFLRSLPRWDGRRRNVAQRSSALVERTSIPAISLADIGDTYHFGARLQTDPALPTNYVAQTVRLESLQRTTLFSRILLTYLKQGRGARDVFDLTVVIAGIDKDEMPERALASVRIVRANMAKVALPLSFIRPLVATRSAGEEYEEPRSDVSTQVWASGVARLYFTVFLADPVRAAFQPLARAFSGRVIDNGDDERIAPGRSRRKRIPTKRSSSESDTPMLVSTDDPLQQAVNQLIEILRDIKVPVRFDTMKSASGPSLIVDKLPGSRTQAGASADAGPLEEVSLLRLVTRNDLLRFFVGSNCSLKKAAVRVVESMAWRGLTFPICIKSCRVELQSGQFFQQGFDRMGNPVFYFRHTLLGPWRKDEDAVIAAVLHRLESSIGQIQTNNSDARCTLIVVMGRPFKKKKRKAKKTSGSASSNSSRTGETHSQSASRHGGSIAGGTAEVDGDSHSDDDGETVDTLEYNTPLSLAPVNNPRIPADETWFPHTSKSLVKRLVLLIMYHYPERLHRCLVVMRHGNKSYTNTALSGLLSLPQVVPAASTRHKVEFLTDYVSLRQYVAKEELVTLVGGNAPMAAKAFDDN